MARVQVVLPTHAERRHNGAETALSQTQCSVVALLDALVELLAL